MQIAKASLRVTRKGLVLHIFYNRVGVIPATTPSCVDLSTAPREEIEALSTLQCAPIALDFNISHNSILEAPAGAGPHSPWRSLGGAGGASLASHSP